MRSAVATPRSAISVLTAPGWTTTTLTPSWATSRAQRVAGGFEREFRAGVGAIGGHRDLAADRADVDDGPLVPEQRRLGHRDVPEQVDLELLAPLCEWQRFDRRVDGNASVVHQRA